MFRPEASHTKKGARVCGRNLLGVGAADRIRTGDVQLGKPRQPQSRVSRALPSLRLVVDHALVSTTLTRLLPFLRQNPGQKKGRSFDRPRRGARRALAREADRRIRRRSTGCRGIRAARYELRGPARYIRKAFGLRNSEGSRLPDSREAAELPARRAIGPGAPGRAAGLRGGDQEQCQSHEDPDQPSQRSAGAPASHLLVGLVGRDVTKRSTRIRSSRQTFSSSRARRSCCSTEGTHSGSMPPEGFPPAFPPPGVSGRDPESAAMRGSQGRAPGIGETPDRRC